MVQRVITRFFLSYVEYSSGSLQKGSLFQIVGHGCQINRREICSVCWNPFPFQSIPMNEFVSKMHKHTVLDWIRGSFAFQEDCQRMHINYKSEKKEAQPIIIHSKPHSVCKLLWYETKKCFKKFGSNYTLLGSGSNRILSYWTLSKSTKWPMLIVIYL